MAARDLLDATGPMTCGYPTDDGPCTMPLAHPGPCPPRRRSDVIVSASVALVAAVKAERAAVIAQDRLHGDSLRAPPNITQDQIEAAGKHLKACRYAAMAALAVLEKEVDR